MNEELPLLNSAQLEELNDMVRGIAIDNSKGIEDLIGERINVANSNFMSTSSLIQISTI